MSLNLTFFLYSKCTESNWYKYIKISTYTHYLSHCPQCHSDWSWHAGVLVKSWKISAFLSHSVRRPCNWALWWTERRRRNRLPVLSMLQGPRDWESLGERGHLSRGYIEDSLWFYNQFVQTLSRGYIMESFTKYPPLWSQCKQWSHAGYFLNVSLKVATGYFLNENPGFFHNFVCNASTMSLSHSLRLLSQSTL